MNDKLLFEDESYAIRGAICEVYKTLGNGYLEEVCQNALEEELRLRGIPSLAKAQLHIMYKGRDCGLYEPDFICNDKIIAEIKAVEALHEKHVAQLVNYLHATNYKLGMPVNFGACPKVDMRRRVT